MVTGIGAVGAYGYALWGQKQMREAAPDFDEVDVYRKKTRAAVNTSGVLALASIGLTIAILIDEDGVPVMAGRRVRPMLTGGW